ncbi:precorrin-6y C5,15-methyltransferase (decarboxylating) subunit CbiE [Streptomyces sp. XM4193]|uniref:precorrin-6y C5,15-methyltransferase (decarboxylating) subunit CbiE n=1 Tax=Streptomyces sp. XM4193 TaxID=2929782 RepID=UPI001FFABE71|nr:precorrin-6y C5,15-methyltransferase (decarboxylating) subunit CbiE [Streptomyces sp. XM4193]MCK1798425.1 precorrin-6y C5,15-methyltransferase (decarboxylating) subunit CbiE [Streptomyces sp. XM4193]
MSSENPHPVTVVGIGADGWEGLSEASRDALRAADVILGGARQLALVPPRECSATLEAWPSPLRRAVVPRMAALAGRRVAVLASGDPMFYGIGRTLGEELGYERLRVLPHPSSMSYACARLGWPSQETDVVSVVGRPLERVAARLHDGRRLLVLSSDAQTPARLARLLRERGFGPSSMWVLEQLGGARERLLRGTADRWDAEPGDRLNLVAVHCARAEGALRLGAVPGLPDEAYESDGQLTKRHVRAATLTALAPAPGERLWDVGGGSGSIAIEWLRTHPSCTAHTVERDATRCERIVRNAHRLGVPELHVLTGRAPEALDQLPTPDAVFVGGGVTTPGLLETCWRALPPGGRLVANAVTLESEALLARWYARHGGELIRLAVSHARPVGGFTGWRQAMPVTQWAAVRGDDDPDDGPGTGPEAGPGARRGAAVEGEVRGAPGPLTGRGVSGESGGTDEHDATAAEEVEDRP